MPIHLFHGSTATPCHAGQGIVRHNDRQTRFLGNEPVQIPQQRATASQNDTALGDVRRQLRR